MSKLEQAGASSTASPRLRQLARALARRPPCCRRARPGSRAPRSARSISGAASPISTSRARRAARMRSRERRVVAALVLAAGDQHARWPARPRSPSSAATAAPTLVALESSK